MAELLRGDLGRVSLGSVLQLAESESLCARVALGQGHVLLHNGAVTGAVWKELTGESAAVEALIRARGGFRVEAGRFEGRPVPVMGLVLESCRLLDEVERVVEQHLVAEAGWVRPEALRPLRLDGSHAAAAAIAAADAALTCTIDPLVAALDAGHLRSSGSTPGASDLLFEAEGIEDDTDDVDVDELLFEARKAVRSKAFDAAERALRRALSLRPGDRIVAQNLNRVRMLRAANP